jgi:UDP-2-acetamido-3-amino-2,3-dideoxy-glucuronate N-acetyltransferase
MKQAEHRYRGREWLAETIVAEGATLGAASVVVAGLTIGAHAFVGAGAVVTRDIPSFALVVGNPARVQGWVCVCGTRLDFVQKRTQCQTCGMEFRQTERGVETA